MDRQYDASFREVDKNELIEKIFFVEKRKIPIFATRFMTDELAKSCLKADAYG